ncbi:hypothetical protein [Amycolatopsis sp. CA-128772]|uniref:hypothetical protein n=1 Tax=Amycolatopsis sp. CA-128772 TaxID=2073159 RepID=UPI000CD291CE|nr:hypothetical protein [Amycolatopsis sp. CA-128772]
MPLRDLICRCLIAAVSGLLAALALRVVPISGLCTGPACLLVGMVVAPLVLFGAAALAWVLLALARVRPAWPVALVGPLTVLAVVTTVTGWEAFWVFAAVAAASYAFAALVTADGLPRAWRVAPALPVVVLFAWGVVLPIIRAGL